MTSVSSPPVTFAIISPAEWGCRYLDAIAGSTKLSLRAVCSRSPERAQQVAAKYGGRAYTSYQTILEDPAIEAILLPTPHFLHYEQTKAALLAGKHVMVEKPLANRITEAEDLRRLSEEKRLTLAVGLQGRRTAGIRRAKAMLVSGELGKVGLAVVTHGSPQVHLTYKPGDWETSEETMPGGILDQLGVHYAEVLSYLFGPVRRVSGFVTREISAYPTIDAGAGSYEFDHGIVAVHATHQFSTYISELRIFTDRGLLTVGRMGRELTWEPIANLATAKAGASARQSIPLDGPEMATTALREELEEFADCVRFGGQPEVGAREGVNALRLVRAIMRAHSTGHAVEPASLTE